MVLEYDLRYAEVEVLKERFGWEIPVLEAAAALIELLESAEE
jgi:hypothetical protein